MRKYTGRSKFKAIVIGASAGGLNALRTILPQIPEDFSLPIVVVQHIHPHSNNFFVRHLNEKTQIVVKQADEKEKIQSGIAYFAPPNYHLMIEEDLTFSITTGEKVNYSRPSIDVLFETAADAYRAKLIGLVLTGANDDGSRGLRKIKEYDGLVIVQDPKTAEAIAMPSAAIAATQVDYVLPLHDIGPFLVKIGRQE